MNDKLQLRLWEWLIYALLQILHALNVVTISKEGIKLLNDLHAAGKEPEASDRSASARPAASDRRSAGKQKDG